MQKLKFSKERFRDSILKTSYLVREHFDWIIFLTDGNVNKKGRNKNLLKYSQNFHLKIVLNNGVQQPQNYYKTKLSMRALWIRFEIRICQFILYAYAKRP